MSAEIVPFGAPKRDAGGSWLSGQARCIACKYEWIAVQEANSEGYEGDLECPECHCRRGQYIWPFAGPASEEVWTCNACEGTLFMITRPGTRCVGCGRHQTFGGR